MHSKSGALFQNILEVNCSIVKKNQNNFGSEYLLISELFSGEICDHFSQTPPR